MHQDCAFGPDSVTATSMTLLAVGLNHRTAPVAVRERVAFPPERLGEALTELARLPGVEEAAILSTCNRTELYCGLAAGGAEPVSDWLVRFHRLGGHEVAPYLYRHRDREMVRHVLRVASGLDSMVLGEPQILGQVKDAYEAAVRAGTVGPVLGRLFQHTFAVAKQVRTDTRIGASPVSVAFAAVRLAQQIFGELERRAVLLIGAGETMELVARHLHEAGVARVVVANRSVARARELARPYGGEGIGLPEIPERLAEADIVISSTASPLPILGKGAVERALRRRRHRPMFMVDLAVPRDIEPEVGELDDVYLYTVDDIEQVVQEGLRSRREAAAEAEEIVEAQTERFMAWLRSLGAVGTIRALREAGERAQAEALARARRALAGGAPPEEALALLAHTLRNKLLHRPTVALRQAAAEGRGELLEAARALFGLPDEGGGEP